MQEKFHDFCFIDVLQPAERQQGSVVDDAEASVVVAVGAREVSSAGSGDSFQQDTGELYIRSKRKKNTDILLIS